uniref:Uncharacterized protein n=1 Tax=Anguilla anguilla TaxID=7936 RepID=A0A0E9VPM2_ANGAN
MQLKCLQLCKHLKLCCILTAIVELLNTAFVMHTYTPEWLYCF